jgi:phosphoglycolate phosphatase
MKNTLKGTFDSIIFDLDGTLWDSTVNVADAWLAAKGEVDYIEIDITPKKVASLAGMAYDAIYDKLFPNLNINKRNEFKEICARKELEVLNERGGLLYPELESTLAYLTKRYKLFIVSNCQAGYIEIFLKLHNMHKYFTGHQCYGTKNRPKADNIKDVVLDYNLKSPVYIGDTQGDYESSEKAGVPFIFAGFGFGNVEEGQIATIRNFSDLKELL